MTKLTLLAENCTRRAGLLAEHGLAWWIDTGSAGVLFDTGQGMVLRHNADLLGIDLASASAIVLSHGHYDHAGGLPSALELADHAALWFHPAATAGKYSGRGGKARRISTDFLEQGSFRRPGRLVMESTKPSEVVPGVWMTGEVPRSNDFEDPGGPFFLDAQLTRPDPLLDDQALFFAGDEGLVVVLGCSHAGVVNTLRRIRQLTNNAPVAALFGGAHLEAASPRRLEATLQELREHTPGVIGFNHCTGQRALRCLEREFGPRCLPAHAGDSWLFADSRREPAGSPARQPR